MHVPSNTNSTIRSALWIVPIPQHKKLLIQHTSSPYGHGPATLEVMIVHSPS